MVEKECTLITHIQILLHPSLLHSFTRTQVCLMWLSECSQKRRREMQDGHLQIQEVFHGSPSMATSHDNVSGDTSVLHGRKNPACP